MTKNRIINLVLGAAVFALLSAAGATLRPSGGLPHRSASPEPARVRPGIEVLLDGRLDLVKGKRVGLIVNPTGVDGRLRTSVELLKAAPGVRLVALYGPEHGVRGDAQAGEYVPFYFDKKFELPVFSLYGQSQKPEPGMLKNIDSYMRTRDTDISGTGKIPESAMIKDVDVLVYDIQDVGTRVYTYVATMAYAMEAAAESGLEFIVLDRPDPINGRDLEGPVLDYPQLRSFVGVYPIPQRYAMTIGELALLFNAKYLKTKANLTVIPMAGWRREMWFDETGLPWVIPSPNMPTLETAAVYPGQVLLEGTNMSEGRGTTRPFELCGAPWIDGYDLARRLNALELSGVVFREAWFTPTFSKFAGERCGGVQVHVTDRHRFRSFATSLHLIKLVRESYPEKFQFHAEYFDKVAGSTRVRAALERNASVEEIIKDCEAGLKDFADLRQAYLLY